MRFVAAAFTLRRRALRVAGEVRTVGTVTAATAATMPPPPAIIVAVAILVAVAAALVVAVAAGILLWLRLATTAGDESGQAARIMAPVLADVRLLLRLVRRTMLRLIARRKRLSVARQIRLRLLLRRLRLEAWLVLAHEGLAIVVAVVEVVVGGALRRVLALLRLLLLVIWVLLAELFLRGSDQAEIMLGVLVIVFRRNRVTRALRVARELDVFFRDVRCSAADLHVGSVRLVDPRQRILAFAMTAAAVTAASPHSLLTVSHVLPVR
jgi:hypothetical protein